MTDYPIVNCTKQTLYFDVDWSNQKVYILDNDIDDFEAMPIKPGETIVLDLDVKCEGFHIEDKDGNHV